MNDSLLYEERGGGVLFAMNRPHERNALSTVEICDGFEDRCEATERDALGIAPGDGDAWFPPRIVDCHSGQIPLDPHLEIAGASQTIVHETKDHREALAAVFEKRTPSLKNR